MDRSSGVLDRRMVLLGLGFAGAAALTWAAQPRKHIDYLGSRKLEHLIPPRIGSWRFLTTSGLVVPPSDALAAMLYGQLLTRVYEDGINPPIMLLIAQSSGQTGLLQVHRPEFCYPAAGFELSKIVSRTIATDGRELTVDQLTAVAPGRPEQILYWTRIGNSTPRSWAQQRLAVAVDNLKGYIPDAVLVRVSTVEADSAAAFARLSNFVENMIAALPADAARVFVGTA